MTEQADWRDVLRIAVRLWAGERKRCPIRVDRMQAGKLTSNSPIWPRPPAPRHERGGESHWRYDGLFDAPFLRWPAWMLRTHNRFRVGPKGELIVLDGAAYLTKPDSTPRDGDDRRIEQQFKKEMRELSRDGVQHPQEWEWGEYEGQKSLDSETKGGWSYGVADVGASAGAWGQGDPEWTADKDGPVFDAEARQLRREKYDDRLHEKYQRSIDALPHDKRALVRKWARMLPNSYRRQLTQQDIAALYGVHQSTVSRRLDEVLERLAGKLKKKSLATKLKAVKGYAESDD